MMKAIGFVRCLLCFLGGQTPPGASRVKYWPQLESGPLTLARDGRRAWPRSKNRGRLSIYGTTLNTVPQPLPPPQLRSPPVLAVP